MRCPKAIFFIVLCFALSCKSIPRINLKKDAISSICSKDKNREGVNFEIWNTTRDTFELKYLIGSRQIPVQIISPDNDTKIINDLNQIFRPEQYVRIIPDSMYSQYWSLSALRVVKRGVWKFQISIPELKTSSSCEVEFNSEYLPKYFKGAKNRS